MKNSQTYIETYEKNLNVIKRIFLHAVSLLNKKWKHTTKYDGFQYSGIPFYRLIEHFFLLWSFSFCLTKFSICNFNALSGLQDKNLSLFSGQIPLSFS